MRITQIIVNVHEKRNHPHEYGHYDASVTLTADAEPDDMRVDAAIQSLQKLARWQVFAECDQWIAKVQEEKRIQRLLGDLRHALRNLQWNKFGRARECVQIIRQLPEDIQAEHLQKLRDALAKTPIQSIKVNFQPEEDGEIPF